MLRHNETDQNKQNALEDVHRWIHVKQRGVVSAVPREKMTSSIQIQQANDAADADIEALRAAYKTVLASDAMANLRVSAPQQNGSRPASFLQTLRQMPQEKPKSPHIPESRQDEPASAVWEELGAEFEKTGEADSWRARLFKQPTWFISLSIGLCLAVSAAYAGLGYWLLVSGAPSQAAETATVLSQENVTEEATSQQGLENLHKLQEQNRGGIVVPEENPSEPEALNLLAMAKSPPGAMASGLPEIKRESVGRSDPFAPLLHDGVDNTPLMLQPKDILDDVMFTGFVNDVNAKDPKDARNKVAIIQVSSGGVPKTLVKKVGETIIIDGEKLTLKSIAKDAITLSVKGKSRRLALNPYMDTTTSSAGGASGSASLSGISPAGGGSATGASNPEAPVFGERRDSANPKLMEPGG